MPAGAGRAAGTRPEVRYISRTRRDDCVLVQLSPLRREEETTEHARVWIRAKGSDSSVRRGRSVWLDVGVCGKEYQLRFRFELCVTLENEGTCPGTFCVWTVLRSLQPQIIFITCPFTPGSTTSTMLLHRHQPTAMHNMGSLLPDSSRYRGCGRCGGGFNTRRGTQAE
jgi:hypothetical protein